MSRDHALYLIVSYPALKAYIAAAWMGQQDEEILDLLFGLETEDQPTTH